MGGRAGAPALDIVIPCLNAAGALPATLASLAGAGNWARVIVVDGGSTDDTASVARGLGATLVTAPRGRGGQLAAGAAAGSASWLLFLHADTRLSAPWRRAVANHMADSGMAGYFRLRFASDHPAARRVERLAAWRCRAFGLPYGDQGLLIARAFYERLGGYAPLPLMEDVDFVRRIGRGNLVELDAEAVTAPTRYERDGWTLRPARNLLCLSLYAAGVPPRLIRRVYG